MNQVAGPGVSDDLVVVNVAGEFFVRDFQQRAIEQTLRHIEQDAAASFDPDHKLPFGVGSARAVHVFHRAIEPRHDL